jgi:hypothetical protein
MKIIEFDKEGVGARAEPTRAAPARDASSGGSIKVKVFDDDRAASAKEVATPDQVGFIKIIEFDKQPAARAAEPSAPARPAPPTAGAMKIVDFDKPATAKPTEARARGGMKIVEFD